MAEHRINPRLTVDLPVRVWGMSAEGRPFSQHARAQNISAQGALITGVECALKVGDVIGVQCEETKARCTIMWIMSSGFAVKNQVGLRLLTGQECPWKNYINLKVTTEEILQSQKRRWHRHKIALPLEIRDERSTTPARVNASDVSGNGCYVENMLPFPLGTILRLEFHIEGTERVTLTAIVRTCDPGVGNGIEFTGLTPETKVKVQAYLDRIDPPRGPQVPRAQ